jgi:hypothetical protein
MDYTLGLEKVGEDAFVEFINQEYTCIFFPNCTSSGEVVHIILNAIRKVNTKKNKIIIRNLTFATSLTFIDMQTQYTSINVPTQFIPINIKPEHSLIPEGFVADLGHSQIRLHAIINNKIVETVFLPFGGENVSRSLISTKKSKYIERYFQSKFFA